MCGDGEVRPLHSPDSEVICTFDGEGDMIGFFNIFLLVCLQVLT